MVVWADHHPVGNARIRLAPNNTEQQSELLDGDDTTRVEVHTDPAGHYEAQVCPCR
jgi:hypothetical protein